MSVCVGARRCSAASKVALVRSVPPWSTRPLLHTDPTSVFTINNESTGTFNMHTRRYSKFLHGCCNAPIVVRWPVRNSEVVGSSGEQDELDPLALAEANPFDHSHNGIGRTIHRPKGRPADIELHRGSGCKCSLDQRHFC